MYTLTSNRMPGFVLFVLQILTPIHCSILQLQEPIIPMCPNKDSCGTTDVLARRCECDIDCHIYGDCCLDAFVPETAARNRNKQLTCIQIGDLEYSNGAFMIDTCSENFTATFSSSAKIESHCRNHNNVEDPLMSTPVTDPISEITYRNRYCAYCNNAFRIDLLSWLIELKCKVPILSEELNGSVDREITFNPSLNKWGIQFEGQFHVCKVGYEIPTYLMNKVRQCDPTMVSSCPDTWRDLLVRDLCEHYVSIVYGANNVPFKNPDCAVCNGYDVSDVKCDIDAMEREEISFSFGILMDTNLNDGAIKNPNGKSCKKHEIYDPFFKKCRNVVCALPGYKMIRGKCFKEEQF